MTQITQSMTGSGTIGDISSWRVTEGSTPISIASTQGGTGSVALGAKAKSDTRFVINNGITVTHDKLGSVSGTVTDVSISGITANMTIASAISTLSVTKVVPPTGSQNLSAIFATYVALCSPVLSVNYIASLDPVRIFGGWTGDVWTHLKWLCAAMNVEMAFSGNVITVRDVGVQYLAIDDMAKPVTNYSTATTGRNVEIVYQNYSLISAGALSYNYSKNPSLEVDASNWTTNSTYGTVTAGRAT